MPTLHDTTSPRCVEELLGAGARAVLEEEAGGGWVIRLLTGDCRVTLPTLETGSVQVVVTSPPYWGLRDYGTEPLVWGQTCCEHPHEWGEPVPGDPRGGSGPNAKEAYGPDYGRQVARGSFCTHVHEWADSHAAGWHVGSREGIASSTLNNSAATHQANKKVTGAAMGSACPCGAWRGSLGLEPTPDLYVSHMVEVFGHIRRVLSDSGVVWLNLGDSYAGSGKGPSNSIQGKASQIGPSARQKRGLNNLADTPTEWIPIPSKGQRVGSANGESGHTSGVTPPPGYKAKDLMMIPARVAIALQEDGWYLRSMMPWLKRNCLPEHYDRPSTSVEYVFLLSKRRTYYWDAKAVRTDSAPSSVARAQYNGGSPNPKSVAGAAAGVYAASVSTAKAYGQGRNRRNGDWFFESWQGLLADEDGDPLALVVNPTPLKAAHYATFPPKLVEPMIKASTRPGDTVLDPFSGAGTVSLVADRLGRNAIGCELKDSYGEMGRERVVGEAPMFVEFSA